MNLIRTLNYSATHLLKLCAVWLLPVVYTHAGDSEAGWHGGAAISTLERYSGTDTTSFELETWASNGLHTLSLTLEIEKTGSITQETEIYALYSRPISEHWELFAGGRRDVRPHPQRNWLTAGLTGEILYGIVAETAFYAGTNDRRYLSVTLEREVTLPQQLSLVPELEFDIYGHDDPALGIGKGLGEGEAAVRLYYPVNKYLSPYAGILRYRLFGDTADYARSGGNRTGDTHFLLGISASF